LLRHIGFFPLPVVGRPYPKVGYCNGIESASSTHEANKRTRKHRRDGQNILTTIKLWANNEHL
jgi:hypothetical protein